MKRFFSLRRIALALAALGLFALAAPRAGAQEVPFHADGIFNFAQLGGNRGALVSGSGHASPGGALAFEDVVHGRVDHGVHLIEGTITLVFAGGTLTIYYEAPIDENNVVMGPYWVVGGTGLFEGVSGYGIIWYPIGQGAPFTLDGEIDR